MPPRDVFEGDPTRGQRERVEAQTGGRRGSTRTRSDQDPRGMYGPREQTGTVTVDLGGDRGGTTEVATYGGPTQQGINIGFDSGYGEKAGTLSFQEFMNVTGRSETNPYGKQGFFSRVFGIDPNKINYATNTPGGIATLAKVNALAYDQYLNPRDAQGNIRGFLREGSPTRFGTVVNDPTLEKDLGIMGAIPYIGGFLRAANRRSALNISPYDNPLFSEMGDIGFELGEFPEGAVAAAPAAQAAPTSAISNVFEPFTTDPDIRNPESYFADINTRPQETPVTPGFTRPDDTTMPSVADVIAAEPMVTEPVDPRLPTGPKVIQAIPGGDPGSASITINPRTESPTYTAPDEPVDLLQDILAPDGSPLPGVMDVIGSSETGRTSSAAPILDIPEGGFPDPRVSPPQLTSEQVQRANENNVATQRRLQLMAEGMSGDAAMMQAEREKIRARAARLGLGQ